MRITKSEISMRTWRSPMSAASQGAFVVIPEISLCDISYIIRKSIAVCSVFFYNVVRKHLAHMRTSAGIGVDAYMRNRILRNFFIWIV